MSRSSLTALVMVRLEDFSSSASWLWLALTSPLVDQEERDEMEAARDEMDQVMLQAQQREQLAQVQRQQAQQREQQAQAELAKAHAELERFKSHHKE